MSDHLILLLEDQPLISLDLEDALAAAGFTDVVNMRSRSDAMAWLGEHSPEMVVLDLHLADGDCHEVLEALNARGIPSVIYSGTDMPEGWKEGPFAASDWIEKPADPVRIAEIVARKLALFP